MVARRVLFWTLYGHQMDSISALVDGINPRRQMIAGRVFLGHSTITKWIRFQLWLTE